MIVFDQVSKTYPVSGGKRTVILDNFSGILRPGNNVGILGRNGAGKSTFMRLIAGGEPPSSGEVLRSGRISWPLGFSGGFNQSLTGRQNVRFIARLYDVDFEETAAFVEDFAQIGRFFDQPLRTYSSGMKARLAFGTSMAIDFDYYLIDEVIAVGDASFKARCKAVFDERRERATIILVSHSSKLLKDFCDVGGILSDGQLQFYEDIDEAISVHECEQKK